LTHFCHISFFLEASRPHARRVLAPRQAQNGATLHKQKQNYRREQEYERERARQHRRHSATQPNASFAKHSKTLRPQHSKTLHPQSRAQGLAGNFS